MSQLLNVPGPSQDAFTALNNQIAKRVPYENKSGETVNCDNLTSTGIYRLSGTITNSPNNSSRLALMVLESADNFITQIAYNNLSADAGMYIRRKLSGQAWSSWQELALKSNVDSFETVTSANTNVTVLKGGYKQFGKLTLICISIRATANISATTAIIGVPAAWQANAPLVITKPGQSPNILDAECRVYNGYIYPGVALATGSEYTIQGMYIAS